MGAYLAKWEPIWEPISRNAHLGKWDYFPNGHFVSLKQTAFGALRRTTLCTRQRVLRGANESGDGEYESVTMGRAAAM